METTECYALSVNIRGGSSVCISECGGIQLRSGEMLIVQAPLAEALYKQYKPHLSRPIPARINGRLRHSYYDTRRVNVLLNPDPASGATSESEHSSDEAKPVTDVKEKPKEFMDMVSDRSMDSPPAKKKRRTRKTVKKKQEGET